MAFFQLFVHSSLESLYQHIPKKLLPKDFGGETSSIAEIISHSLETVDKYRAFFEDEAQYGTDESLRVGKPIDFDSLFGVQGSFRALNVD